MNSLQLLEKVISSIRIKRKYNTKRSGVFKTCVNCGEEKPIENFYIRITSLDGRHSWCKECVKTKAKNTRHETNTETD